jgi:Uma2 family endonuclease
LADSRRRADRVIWVGLGRVPDIHKDVPAIVVEFVSNRKRDRVRDYEEKRREYLAIGVSEYWIIDRFKRTLTVVRNAPGQPSEIVVQAEETYQSPLLPGFDLPLKQLLKLADDWAAANQKRKRDKNREQPN